MESVTIPRLTGDRIILSLFRTDEEAAKLYAKWMSDETTCVNIESNGKIVDTSYMAGWLTDNHAMRMNIVERATGDLIGYCHIDNREIAHAAWLSINIGDQAVRGRGYGTEVVNLMTGFCFNELGVESVHLDVLETNKAGIRCYEKVGFKISGRYRRHCIHNGLSIDWLHMDIIKEEWYLRRV